MKTLISKFENDTNKTQLISVVLVGLILTSLFIYNFITNGFTNF